jgi:beta-glucosidase
MKCDRSCRLSYTDKVKEMIAGLTLEEKVSQMSGIGYYFGGNFDVSESNHKHYNYRPFYCGGIDEKNIPRMLFSDGTRGVIIGNKKNTCFPVTMLRGATFDTDLEERIGHAIGREVRARDCNLFAGVCINLPYHPGWGRSQETYGEDSYHIGQMGAALVRGVQEEQVIACIKHYAFNSMELSRYKVNIVCSKRTEREVFLPHFKECIDQGAAAVMSAYNSYQGSFCGQNDYLLQQVLKQEWGFDGFVMSDFNDGIKDTVTAANNGQDMEMCNTKFYGNKLVEAVREGKVSEERIDEAVLRIVRTLVAFREKEDKKYDRSVLGCKEHIDLALEAARKGITLLQNKDGVLPFKKEKSARVVIFGKLADRDNTGDHGCSRVYPEYTVSPLKGIAKICRSAEVIYYPGDDLEHAKRLAKEADYTIFIVGYNHDDEGEHVEGEDGSHFSETRGGDRINCLGLHEEEIELLNTVGPINQNSAAVLIGGSMIITEDWKSSVSAILMAYYPGMEGGTAIAEILFGDVNPSGKLPFVITKKETDLPDINWVTDYQYYDYYHGYAKLEKEGIEPSTPFGFGLSYTTFSVTEANFTAEEGMLLASCTVENTGSREGEEVIQFYVGYRNSTIDRPIKELKGFTRAALQPGEKKRVVIKTPVDKLRWYNEAAEGWELEHMEYELYIGTSSADKDLIEGRLVL